MIRKNKSFLIALFLSAFFIIFFTPIAFSADTLLSVPERIQEHDQWCWDASSQAILEYYAPVVTQCDIANWVFQRNDCCGNPIFHWELSPGVLHQCNNGNFLSEAERTRSIQGVLTQWGGLNSTAQGAALSQENCVSEVNAGRPFVLRFDWKPRPVSGAHALVGYGYDQSGLFLDYMDPWPGNGYTKSLYTWVVDSPNHTWTQTLTITTNPRPTVTTGAASSISSLGATLNGTVNAYSTITTVTFEYGTTTSYGNTMIADQSPVTGNAVTAVSKAITGLAPNTRYHYRVNGASSEGTSNGNDMTFTNINLVPIIYLLLD